MTRPTAYLSQWILPPKVHYLYNWEISSWTCSFCSKRRSLLIQLTPAVIHMDSLPANIIVISFRKIIAISPLTPDKIMGKATLLLILPEQVVKTSSVIVLASRFSLETRIALYELLLLGNIWRKLLEVVKTLHSALSGKNPLFSIVFISLQYTWPLWYNLKIWKLRFWLLDYNKVCFYIMSHKENVLLSFI